MCSVGQQQIKISDPVLHEPLYNLGAVRRGVYDTQYSRIQLIKEWTRNPQLLNYAHKFQSTTTPVSKDSAPVSVDWWTIATDTEVDMVLGK
jgi:hypothetical protein